MAIPREVGKQSKKLTNTRVLRRYKQSLKLNQLQKDFLFGTMLGDGCLITSRSGLSARLQVRQNRDYKDYVWWKYGFFKSWVLTQPREDLHNNSLYFRTISHPDLMEIKELFYRNSNRVVPDKITSFLKSPLSLAVWVMDDGNGNNKRACFRISSYGFGRDGNRLLQRCLVSNFSLQATVYSDSKGYYLYFPRSEAYALYRIVKPHILPCMSYKFASLTP